ncbi:MAG TPA: acyl-CoA desaturase [Acidimicrobiales bacterium]|nr:acyl-CoA desaturase [Acidimicrobiales bacterium]
MYPTPLEERPLERDDPDAATPTVSTADFRELALQVRAAGLLDRRRAYYVAKICLTIAALAGGWAAFVTVGDSWLVLGVAVLLGAVFAQLGFLGHDAGHQQIFASRRANRLVGLLVGNVLIGLSFGWWVPKHNAHHSHPNEMERDPDVGSDFFGIFGDPAAKERTGLGRLFVRWRAPLFFPLMLLRSLGLHVGGARQLFSRHDRGAIGEGLLILAHAATFLTLVAVVLSPLKALAFVAVQQAVFSLYIGLSFAPNHKGMPLVPAGSKLDFAHRQVVTSRNVAGGAVLTFVLGGLDYQIEHHLFPSMPRPNLRHAQRLVKAFCCTNRLTYCEVSFFNSFRLIVRHLRASSGDERTVRNNLAVPGELQSTLQSNRP